MRVAIIGAGLQARRRAPAVIEGLETDLVAIAAAHQDKACALAQRMGCEAMIGWESVINRKDIDAVIVCTPPHLHAPITIAAAQAGKHVLCEKPLARTLEEAEQMLATAKQNEVVVKCGLNHRHHPGVKQAKEWLSQGRIGQLMFIRCRYGHCGHPAYEKDWRSNPQLVSGGQLMEHGIHALDLFRWFLGDFDEVMSFRQAYYWPIQPLEDNAFALFRTSSGQVASLHSSLTQWKNLFSFEIFGQDGYVVVEGLGGSYGTERAILGKRDFTAPFGEQTIEYRGEDRSWYEEWKEFVAAAQEGRKPLGSGEDGQEAMRLVFAAYESARKEKVIGLP